MSTNENPEKEGSCETALASFLPSKLSSTNAPTLKLTVQTIRGKEDLIRILGEFRGIKSCLYFKQKHLSDFSNPIIQYHERHDSNLLRLIPLMS